METEPCELCDGIGEIEAFTARAENRAESVGCPLCIQRDRDAEITSLKKALGMSNRIAVNAAAEIQRLRRSQSRQAMHAK